MQMNKGHIWQKNSNVLHLRSKSLVYQGMTSGNRALGRTNLSRKPKQAAGWNWSPKFTQQSFLVGAASVSAEPHLHLDGEQFQARNLNVEPAMYSIQSLEANIVPSKLPMAKPLTERKKAGQVLKPLFAQGREIPARQIDVVHWMLPDQGHRPIQSYHDQHVTEAAEPAETPSPPGKGFQGEPECAHDAKITEPAYAENRVPAVHEQPGRAEEDGDEMGYQEMLLGPQGALAAQRQAAAAGSVDTDQKDSIRQSVVLKKAANSRSGPLEKSKSQVHTERLSRVSSPPGTVKDAARQKSTGRNLLLAQLGKSRSSSESPTKQQNGQLMNRDILQLLGRAHPSEESLETVHSSQRGLRSRLDRAHSPGKGGKLHGGPEDRSSGEGSEGKPKSRYARLPYANMGSDVAHDATRAPYAGGKKVQRPAPYQPGQLTSIRSTIVMPVPVPHLVAELEQQQVHLGKQFPAREAPIMRVGDLNNYGYRMQPSHGRKFAVNQQLLVDASVKLSLEHQEKTDTEAAGEILKGFRGVKMSLGSRGAEAATAEPHGLDAVAAGSSRGMGVRARQPAQKPSQPVAPELENHLLYISKARDEDLRSPTSNQAGLFKPSAGRGPRAGSPKAPVIPSPRAQSDAGSLPSQETARLPTEAATTTMNKARDPLSGTAHYYSGAAGARKKPLQPGSPGIPQPFQSTPQGVETPTQGGRSPQKEPATLDELLKMNAQHIKIDIQHKPVAGTHTQLTQEEDLGRTAGGLSAGRLEETKGSAPAPSNLSQQSFYEQLQLMALTQREHPSGPYPTMDQIQHATARARFGELTKLDYRDRMRAARKAKQTRGDIEHVMGREVGQDKRFASIYDDKGRLLNESSAHGRANAKSSALMQRKLSSQGSNTSVGFGPASHSNIAAGGREQAGTLRPLGYKPPKTQMVRVAAHGVDILPERRRGEGAQQSGLTIAGPHSLLKAQPSGTRIMVRQGDGPPREALSRALVMAPKGKGGSDIAQKIQKKLRREWNNGKAQQRKEAVRLRSRFASKGGGLHNFKQRDARIQQERQEYLHRQELQSPSQGLDLVMLTQPQKSEERMQQLPAQAPGTQPLGIQELVPRPQHQLILEPPRGGYSTLELGVPADPLQAQDEVLSTVQDDVYDTLTSARASMKHQWQHGPLRSSREFQRREQAQSKADGSIVSQTWEVKPVANIELIAQVDEEDDYGQDEGQRQPSARTLGRDQSAHSLRRHQSKQGLQDVNMFGVQPPQPEVTYAASYLPIGEASGGHPAHASANLISISRVGAERAWEQKNHPYRELAGASGSQRAAEINRLRAHIRPNKQTRASNGSHEPHAKEASLASLLASPQGPLDSQRTVGSIGVPEAARNASVESSLERRYFSSEQAFAIYSNQFQSTRVAAKHTKHSSTHLHSRKHGKAVVPLQSSPAFAGTPSALVARSLRPGAEAGSSYQSLHEAPHSMRQSLAGAEGSLDKRLGSLPANSLDYGSGKSTKRHHRKNTLHALPRGGQPHLPPQLTLPVLSQRERHQREKIIDKADKKYMLKQITNGVDQDELNQIITRVQSLISVGADPGQATQTLTARQY